MKMTHRGLTVHTIDLLCL